MRIRVSNLRGRQRASLTTEIRIMIQEAIGQISILPKVNHTKTVHDRIFRFKIRKLVFGIRATQIVFGLFPLSPASRLAKNWLASQWNRSSRKTKSFGQKMTR